MPTPSSMLPVCLKVRGRKLDFFVQCWFGHSLYHNFLFCVLLTLLHFAFERFAGLNHMHTRGILYRDLKPENVLIGEDGYPVLVDLGFAKKLVESKAFTMCGSPFYIAPEVLLGTGE